MNFTKPTLSFDDQIQRLIERGLIIENKSDATNFLKNVSYYRLRAYTFPYQKNDTDEPVFLKNVTFNQIKKLYDFDRELRILILDAIEKIEVSIRTQIIYQWAINHGSHWQLNTQLYRNIGLFAKHLSTLQSEIDRSTETFIEHYKKKYSNPNEPPSWMSFEVSSFGLLSHIFFNLKKGTEKKEVVKYFGINKIEIFENWMHSFSNIRNICAHHGRLWNRRLVNHIELPFKTSFPFIENYNLYPYKIYSVLIAMIYILKIIDPLNSFKDKLIYLIENAEIQVEKEMGFPNNWKNEPIWN